MKVNLHLKKQSASTYEQTGVREYEVLPRHDEFISLNSETGKKYFQVVAVHFPEGANIELYAIQAEAPWEYKKSGNIGFSFK